ncbi:hypothetical protein EDD21DRAFT_429979 [Dissophora ornata]|nr:hypothetical protein EDD21DRAFT_429979 [Dissophora ornata]
MQRQQPVSSSYGGEITSVSEAEGSNSSRRRGKEVIQKHEFVTAELRAGSDLEVMNNCTFKSENIAAELQETGELEERIIEAIDSDPEVVLYEQDPDGQSNSNNKGKGKATETPRKRKARPMPPRIRKRPAKEVIEAVADNLTTSDNTTTVASTFTSTVAPTVASTASSAVVFAQEQQGSHQSPTQADYGLHNAFTQKEALLRVVSTRKEVQVKSAQVQYKKYQEHWTLIFHSFRPKAWCERKRYNNYDKITREKVLAYVAELLAPQTIVNADNPHLSVLPIRVNRTDTYDGDCPSYPTIAFYHKAVRDLYIQQCVNENVAADIAGTTGEPEIQALLDGYRKEYHEKMSTNDAQQLTSKGSAPDFRMHDWKSHYLVFASDKDKPMDAATLYRSQSQVTKLAHHTSSKVTHGGRKTGAHHVQSNGAGIEDIAQHGIWNHRRLITPYLSPVAQTVPYTMAGFRSENEDFWIARNTVIPPIELQKQVFPFIEALFPGNVDWAKWMENIMLDRPEDSNRLGNEAVTYPDEYIPAMRIMLILAHLRKSSLQRASLASTTAVHQHERGVNGSMDRFLREEIIDNFNVAASNSNDGWSRTFEGVHRETMAMMKGLQVAVDNLAQLTSRSIGHVASDMEVQHHLQAQQAERRATEQQHQLSSRISRGCADHHVSPPRQHPQEQHLLEQHMSQQEFDQWELDALDQHQQEEEQPQQTSDQRQPEQDHEQLDQVEPEEEQRQRQEEEVDEAFEVLKLESLAYQVAENYVQLPIDQIKAAAPNFSMLPRGTPIFPLWDEWFSAQGPRPSIWSLNRFQKDWRKGWNANLRNQYMLKRRIVYATLREVVKAEGPTLNDRISRGKTTMDIAMKKAGTPNAYFKSIQRKKEK